jgi:DNA-binding transcriptional ArsR family regulator
MTRIYQSRERAGLAVEKLKVFAQPQRLMILSCLLDGEHSVSEIEAATAVGQPALSQQLAELRRAGWVATRRMAKQVCYRLADDAVATCVRTIEATFGGGDATAIARARTATPPPTDPSPTLGHAGAAAFARTY